MIMIEGKRPRICIDPGHGGHDSGAVGPQGTKESDIVLAISKELMYQLELKKIDSFLTRTDDIYLKLSQRTNKAEGATCFVSIHCNAFSKESAQGIETLYGAPGGRSKALANYLQQAMLKGLKDGKHKNRGIKMSPSKGYPRNLFVLRSAPCPASLVECEFISNPDQEKFLKDPTNQTKIAYALACGIESFLYSLPGGQCVEDSQWDMGLV